MKFKVVFKFLKKNGGTHRMVNILFICSDGGKMARNLYANPLEVFMEQNLCGPIIVSISHCSPPYKMIDFSSDEYWNLVTTELNPTNCHLQRLYPLPNTILID